MVPCARVFRTAVSVLMPVMTTCLKDDFGNDVCDYYVKSFVDGRIDALVRSTYFLTNR